jgi:hypothetical protein
MMRRFVVWYVCGVHAILRRFVVWYIYGVQAKCVALLCGTFVMCIKYHLYYEFMLFFFYRPGWNMGSAHRLDGETI